MWPKTLTWWLWRSRFLGRSCGWTPSSGLPSPFILGVGQGPLRFLEESELLKFLNELRQARPELTTDDINRFCTELAAIRREGVGFDCEEIFTGVRCVAAPIFDYTGNLVATIGCSVPTVRITEESSALLIREVIQTAAAISMSIGAPRREFMPTTRTMLHCPVRG